MIRRFQVFLFTLLFPAFLLAVPATGTFQAEQVCPLYQSKAKGTNPGGVFSDKGALYPVAEVLPGGDSPEWARVEVSGELRWMEATCGSFQDLKAKEGGGASAGGGQCRTPGKADSYVLAISWQPAFCERMGEKPECKALKPSAYAARHFTLHGLWPNQDACGINYGYCSPEVPHKLSGSFCNYPLVPLTPPVREKLEYVMPSAEAGSCLQRHEWWKHGTCQEESADGYFLLAVELLDQINDSSFVDFIQDSIGKEVDRARVMEAFDKAFGENAHTRMGLSCGRDGKMLGEIQFNLPVDPNISTPLETLLKEGEPFGGRTSCPETFLIDKVE